MHLSSFLSSLSFHSYLLFLFPFSAFIHFPLFSLLFLTHYLLLALDIFLISQAKLRYHKFLCVLGQGIQQDIVREVFKDKIAVWKKGKKIQRWPPQCTHISTPTYTNTQLASVFITQQRILGAEDREIEKTSHLHFSKPLEPFHLYSAFLLHLFPCLHKFYQQPHWNLFFSLYTASYKSMWLSLKCCILTCFSSKWFASEFQ